MMPLPLIFLLFTTLSVVAPANGEALLVSNSEVIAATIVAKSVHDIKEKESSAPEESKEEVKSES